MTKDVHLLIVKAAPKFWARFVHNLHDLGLALVPILCERLIWIALLVFAIFLAFTAVQALATEEINNVI